MNTLLKTIILGCMLTACAHQPAAKPAELDPVFIPPVMPGFKMENTGETRDGCPLYKLTSSYGVEYLVTCMKVDLSHE